MLSYTETITFTFLLYECLCLLSIAVIKRPDQKRLGEKLVVLSYTSISQSIAEGSPGKNSKHERGDKNRCRGCRLTLLPALLLFKVNKGDCVEGIKLER